MPRYIEWDDVVSRYQNVSDLGGAVEISGTYIQYGEAEIESRLAGFFTVPFSSNNITAKDLSIDATFKRVMMFKDTKKADAVGKHLDKFIEQLINGERAMVTDSGDVMYTAGKGDAHSNTQDYQPVFNMNEPEDQWIDDDQLDDEYQAKL